MKAPLALSLLALALSACGAGLAAFVLREQEPAPASSGAALPVRTGPDAGLLARLDALEEENRRLRDRLALLEARPAPSQRVPVVEGLASRMELEALRAELQSSLDDPPPVPLPAPQSPEFKELLADTMAEIKKDEAVEKYARYLEGREERLEDDVAEIERWLGLTGSQSNRMRAALVLQYEREHEVRRLWEDGVEDELLGERKRSDGQAFHDELATFLTPDQLETFWTEITGDGK